MPTSSLISRLPTPPRISLGHSSQRLASAVTASAPLSLLSSSPPGTSGLVPHYALSTFSSRSSSRDSTADVASLLDPFVKPSLRRPVIISRSPSSRPVSGSSPRSSQATGVTAQVKDKLPDNIRSNKLPTLVSANKRPVVSAPKSPAVSARKPTVLPIPKPTVTSTANKRPVLPAPKSTVLPVPKHTVPSTANKRPVIPALKSPVVSARKPTVLPIPKPSVVSTANKRPVIPAPKSPAVPARKPTVLPVLKSPVVSFPKPKVLPAHKSSVIPSLKPTVLPTRKSPVIPVCKPTIIPASKSTILPIPKTTVSTIANKRPVVSKPNSLSLPIRPRPAKSIPSPVSVSAKTLPVSRQPQVQISVPVASTVRAEDVLAQKLKDAERKALELIKRMADREEEKKLDALIVEARVRGKENWDQCGPKSVLSHGLRRKVKYPLKRVAFVHAPALYPSVVGDIRVPTKDFLRSRVLPCGWNSQGLAERWWGGEPDVLPLGVALYNVEGIDEFKQAPQGKDDMSLQHDLDIYGPSFLEDGRYRLTFAGKYRCRRRAEMAAELEAECEIF